MGSFDLLEKLIYRFISKRRHNNSEQYNDLVNRTTNDRLKSNLIEPIDSTTPVENKMNEVKSSPEVVFNKIHGVLAELAEKATKAKVDIRLDSSLVVDLGFSSFNFVELTLALEETLNIKEFPMQDWIDSQSLNENAEGRFTVEKLVERCVELI